jgi:hypothetical protein
MRDLFVIVGDQIIYGHHDIKGSTVASAGWLECIAKLKMN